MKKTSILFATLALTALFATAGFVHAQTESTSAGSASAVNGTGDTRGFGAPDKPGAVKPKPLYGVDGMKPIPMPKDPKLQQKIIDAEMGLTKARGACATLNTLAAKNNCVKDAEAKFKTVVGSIPGTGVSGTGKISDEDMKKKLDEDRPKTDDQRMEDRVQNEKVNVQANIERSVKELNALFTRLTTIADRIDGAINNQTTKGADTTKAQASVTTARENLAKAKTAIASITTSLQTDIANLKAAMDTAKTDTTAATKDAKVGPFAKTRALIKEARDALQAAHKALMDAAKALNPNPKTPQEPTKQPPRIPPTQNTDTTKTAAPQPQF